MAASLEPPDPVIYALRERAGKKGWSIDRNRVDAICAELAALPVIDARSPDEILGYDEFGLPR